MVRLFFAILVLGLSQSVFANSGKNLVAIRTAKFHATISEYWHDPATGEPKSKIVCQYQGPVDVFDLRKYSGGAERTYSVGPCQGTLEDGHAINLEVMASIGLWHFSPSPEVPEKDIKVFQASYWFDSAPPPSGLEDHGSLNLMMTEDLGLRNTTLWVLSSPGSTANGRYLTGYVTFQDDGK